MISRHHETATPTNITMFTAYTPGRSHHRTFFDIRSRQSGGAREDSDDGDNMDDALSELVKQTWSIWAVSPLFGLDYKDEVKLKQYAKRLRENIAFSIAEENVTYEAKFTPFEDLISSPLDPPALKVLVHAKTDGQDGITCIYTGILLSWGERRKEEKDNVKLPILLSRGKPTVTYAVHSVLCQTFDCLITAMPVSQEDLMWLTTIILNSPDQVSGKKKQRSNHQLILEYHIPGRPTTDFIKFKLPLDAINKLWSKICPPHSSSANPNEQVASIITLEQVQKFFDCIKIQILDNADLDLGYCLLDKLSLPGLTIKSNRMKASNIDAMDRILWFLQEKALLYSPIFSSATNNEKD